VAILSLTPKPSQSFEHSFDCRFHCSWIAAVKPVEEASPSHFFNIDGMHLDQKASVAKLPTLSQSRHTDGAGAAIRGL
jgi:hypothetical protein